MKAVNFLTRMNMKILKILFVSGVVSACFSLQAKNTSDL